MGQVDLQKEQRRGRAARKELALVREHIDSRKRHLFTKFCDPRTDDELYLLREEAQALSRVEEFLEQAIITGELAEQSTEGEA
jgi:hypothetical protein